MPSPTRRSFLASVGAGTTALAGCSAVARLRGPNEQPPESVGTPWTPSPTAWRFPAADVHNTSRSQLSVRDAPAAAWRLDPADENAERSLLAATAATAVVLTAYEETVAVSAHDPADGTRRWRRTFDERPVQGGGLVAGRLFVSVGGTDVLALDPATGTTRWRTRLLDRLAAAVPARFLPTDANDIGAQPLATLGEVYVQSSYGVHGLSPEDGTERWRLYLGSDGDYNDRILRHPSGLAVTERSIHAVYGLVTKQLVAVSATDGMAHADFTRLLTGHGGPPVVTDSGVGVRLAVGQSVTSSGVVAPVVAGYGGGRSRRWSFPGLFADEGPSSVRSPATDGDRVYLPQVRPVDGGYELAVLALDADTGGLAWVHREPVALSPDADLFDQLSLATPAVAGEQCLVCYGVDPPGGDAAPVRVLLALSAQTGREQWRLDPGVQPAGVAVAGDRVYVAGAAGGFAARIRSA